MSEDGMIRVETAGLIFYSWKIFEPWHEQLRAVLTTRIGGVSTGHLKSLNLGHAVGDKSENLRENRNRVSAALGLEGMQWSVADQVHGCRISAVSREESDPHPETDALELVESGIIAGISLADCHPVLIFDPVRDTGLICHAGWRGCAAGIAGKAVNRLVEGGSIRSDLIAAAGPGIGPCCYQVNDDVADEFRSEFDYPDGVILRGENGSLRLNIEAALLTQLRKAGLSEHKVGIAGFCTACRHDEFFSHRKEKGLTGRHSALMALL